MRFILQALQPFDANLPAVDDGSLRLTYGDVRRFVAQEQRWLARAGVGRCAVLADNSARWILTDLALLEGGMVSVPIPGSFTKSQVRHLLNDASIDSVLTDRPNDIATVNDEFRSAGVSNRTGLTLMHRSIVSPDDLADSTRKITYTSGSTGASKGVCLDEHSIESVTRSLVAATAGLGVAKHMCILPLATLLENLAGVYAPLLLGAQIHVRPLSAIGMSYAGLNAPLLLQSITSAQPESLVLVPELLRVLLHAISRGWSVPSSLKFIAVGGASVSIELLRQAEAARLPVFQGYGLSECSSVVCLNTPVHNRLGSVGRPLPHSQVRIDANGEICVRGATMSGYLGQPARLSGEIRTGDLGEIDADGYVYVRGRAKNMFITSMGRNITPEWVERELTAEPLIAHAMVVGEDRPHPVALIAPVCASPAHLIERAVAHANARLPDYAQVRRWALFDESPSMSNGLLTSNGRLRRQEIAARYAVALDLLYAPEECTAHEFS